MVTAGEALRRLLSGLGPLGPSGTERVALDAAADRVPSRAIRSPLAVPAFARAAMDGYAVRAGDTLGAASSRPLDLPVGAQVLAGHPLEHTPPAASAVQIATGAPLPPGMDAVIPLEQIAARTAEGIRVLRPARPGTHVIPPGELLAPEVVVVDRGRPLTPAAIGALAAAGIAEVEVGRRPAVVLLSTGDELLAPGAVAGTAGVYDANSPMLLAGCRAAGARVRHAGRVPDERTALRSALTAALEGGADLVLTTGGVSVGPADLVPQVWQELGARELFWRVAIKPGKPVYAGSIGRTAVIGLPGSPTACWTAFTLLVAPLLRAWAGWDQPFPPAGLLRLGTALATRADALRLLWARSDDAAGTAVPCPAVPAGTLAAMAGADSLVLQPAGSPPLAPGAPVWTLRVDRAGEATDVALPELLDRLGRPHAAAVPARTRPVGPVAVCAFSGDSGHGKTTLIEAILQRLTACGERAAVLKHHGHGTPSDTPGKDGWRLRAAGAVLVAVAGRDGYVLTADGTADPDAWVETLRADAAARGCSWLLIEGFRCLRLPRVELVGDVADPVARGAPGGGLFLIAAARPQETFGPAGVPVIGRDDVDGILAAMRRHCAEPR